MNLIEQTRKSLGPLAEPIIANHAVVPMLISPDGTKKQPAVFSWKDGVNPRGDYEYNALAIMTGRPTGLTVIDYDYAGSLLNSNVKTRRGDHIYVPYDNDRSRSHVLPHIDVRGTGGLAIFHSAFHRVVSRELADRSDFADILDCPAGESLANFNIADPGSLRRSADLGEFIESETVNTVKTGALTEFVAKLAAQGYHINVEAAMRRPLGQMRNAKEGTRNDIFFKNVGTSLLIGGDVQAMVEGARTAGLELSEISKTLKSAIRSGGAPDRFDYAVNRWLPAAGRLFKNPAVAVELARLSVAQWNSEPQFNQLQSEQTLGVVPRTMRRHLELLENNGFVVKRSNGSDPVTGHRYPRNYKLIIPNGL